MISRALKKNIGFTLIELLIVIAIIGTLAGIAVPLYSSYTEKNDINQAKTDIRMIENAIIVFYSTSDRYPDDLAEVGLENMLDPYGNPYQYLPAPPLPVDDGPGWNRMRKDHNLHPVNEDFDLYSMGEDGKSVLPFTAKPSRDDIVRANSGQYLGLASDY